jgi:hypothetical protein
VVAVSEEVGAGLENFKEIFEQAPFRWFASLTAARASLAA